MSGGWKLCVLVCGGRDFNDEDFVINELLRQERDHGDFTRVVHGGAPGVDSAASKFARMSFIEESVFRADWKTWGRAAGPIRNQKMLNHGKPDLVIAFKGGRGTADMVSRARAAGVRVVEVRQ